MSPAAPPLRGGTRKQTVPKHRAWAPIPLCCMEEVLKNIMRFPIRLPDNPLRLLNAYVIRGEAGGRNLLIDTGLPRRESREDLLTGMKDLGLTPENTDVFITHMHLDHIGNAPLLKRLGYRVLISRPDYEMFCRGERTMWRDAIARIKNEGTPVSLIREALGESQDLVFMPTHLEPDTLEDGDTLAYGGYVFTCVLTSGHTIGHMCLYEKQEKILFLGDHVLFDISPNISIWEGFEDPLGSYMESLRAIGELEVRTVLPGHRRAEASRLRERAEEIRAHHRQRLKEIEAQLAAHPRLTGFDLTRQLRWASQGDGWDRFPTDQKYFAVCETLAHLDHLVLTGRVLQEENGEGQFTYRLAPDKEEEP